MLILHPKTVLIWEQQRQKNVGYICGHLRQYYKEKKTVAKESVVLCKSFNIHMC